MKSPTNTTKQADKNPLGVLVEAMALGASGAVERQEAQGQHELVNSDVLPTNLGYGENQTRNKAILESYGVKFLGPVEGDELFQQVELPAGWSKVATDHSMWSDLLDDKGRKRAAIFYKAAFYDRGAHLSLTGRFSVGRDYDREDRDSVCVCQVKDGDKVIHETEPFTVDVKASWVAHDSARDAAAAWLTERYPDWKNHAAYWD